MLEFHHRDKPAKLKPQLYVLLVYVGPSVDGILLWSLGPKTKQTPGPLLQCFFPPICVSLGRYKM